MQNLGKIDLDINSPLKYILIVYTAVQFINQQFHENV